MNKAQIYFDFEFLEKKFNAKEDLLEVHPISLGFITTDEHFNIVPGAVFYFVFDNAKELIEGNSWLEQKVLPELHTPSFNIRGYTAYGNAADARTCIENALKTIVSETNNIEFYGYYSTYDWFLFCQLFGGMMKLPKGCPWYAHDLMSMAYNAFGKNDFDAFLQTFKKPKFEHNAYSDAEWNIELHKAILEQEKKKNAAMKDDVFRQIAYSQPFPFNTPQPIFNDPKERAIDMHKMMDDLEKELRKNIADIERKESILQPISPKGLDETCKAPDKHIKEREYYDKLPMSYEPIVMEGAKFKLWMDEHGFHATSLAERIELYHVFKLYYK